jgi:hypothetical protein
MAAVVEIESQGGNQIVARLSDRGQSAEAWFNVPPEVLSDLGVGPEGAEDLVRRTVAFLLGYQEVADFPQIVDLEDVVAGYPDYRDALRSAAR